MLKLGEDEKNFVDAIGNPSRLKILLALWKSGQELPVYRICRFTRLGRSSVGRHLNNLVENGLVTRRMYGEVVLYSINKDNPRSNALIDFFRKVRL